MSEAQLMDIAGHLHDGLEQARAHPFDTAVDVSVQLWCAAPEQP